MGSNVQVCWEKFCRYWDVEPRLVPVGPKSTCLTAESAAANCDENTIGVVAVMGSTYDGAYEPVADIAAALDNLAASKGVDVPIHVDGASGGFIAPFLDPDVAWDFRIPRVQSINASGHKYGLVYPGVGWIIWRERAALPQELVFNVDYLGGQMPTFALNFSRPGAQIVAQYYNFLRLGTHGYRQVQQASRDTAQWLAKEIEALDPFELVSQGDGIPAFAFRIGEAPYTVYDVSDALRAHGWLVPAYTLPPALDHVAVLRVVVRNGFSRDLAALFVASLQAVTARLSAPHSVHHRVSFHH
jgi:glutamate decarboxylase